MNKIKYFDIFSVIISNILVCLLTCGCEKELDFAYHEIEPVLVIEGSLTTELAEVSLTNTTLMDLPMDTCKISDASVMIIDLTNGEETTLFADVTGVFRSSKGGITGKEYRLNVVVGNELYSADSRMQAPVEIKHLQFHWINMPGDDMAAIQIIFTDNPLSTDYYWIRLYRNGEFYAMNVITDRAQVDGYIEEVMTTTHRDESKENDLNQLLKDGDVMTATVIPIDHSMFDYLIALSNNSNGTPQFNNGSCLGYFLASPVAKASVVYHPEDIDYAE